MKKLLAMVVMLVMISVSFPAMAIECEDGYHPCIVSQDGRTAEICCPDEKKADEDLQKDLSQPAQDPTEFKTAE